MKVSEEVSLEFHQNGLEALMVIFSSKVEKPHGLPSEATSEEHGVSSNRLEDRKLTQFS